MKKITAFSFLLIMSSYIAFSQNGKVSLRQSNNLPVEQSIQTGCLLKYSMDFESVPDFSLSFDPWKVRDIDSSTTFSISEHTFPHSGQPIAFIAFNPAQVTPAMTDPGIQSHGGQKFGACFSATTPSNNDWFISPKIQLGTGGSFTFWARSYTAAYGLEKYKVAVSTTTNNPSAFTFISGSSPLLADTIWSKKSYSLAAYDNQEVYVAIQCVSDTAFIFMIDDLEIRTDSTSVLEADFSASKTVIQQGDSIDFSDQSKGYPTSWNWTFQGGDPSSSDVRNPSGIRYDLPGSYDVMLVVSKDTLTDTIIKHGYISVTTSGLPSSVYLDFEELPDFSLDFYPWAVKDVNGGVTYGIQNCTFPHSGTPMAYICFNPSKAVPPPMNMTPHSGDKFGACFSSEPPKNPNDKWLISPRMQPGTNAKIALWVQSYNITYGYEKFNIGVSTTGTDPSDFTIISGSRPDSAPVSWVRKVYSLENFADQQIFVGIHCITDNGFCFMVDDIEIGSSVDLNDHPPIDGLLIYPNPVKDKLYIDFGENGSGQVKIEICNMLGKIVKQFGTLENSSEALVADLSSLSPGIYLVKITRANAIATKKFLIER
jgi:PKD repeat protein